MRYPRARCHLLPQPAHHVRRLQPERARSSGARRTDRSHHHRLRAAHAAGEPTPRAPVHGVVLLQHEAAPGSLDAALARVAPPQRAAAQHTAATGVPDRRWQQPRARRRVGLRQAYQPHGGKPRARGAPFGDGEQLHRPEVLPAAQPHARVAHHVLAPLPAEGARRAGARTRLHKPAHARTRPLTPAPPAHARACPLMRAHTCTGDATCRSIA